MSDSNTVLKGLLQNPALAAEHDRRDGVKTDGLQCINKNCHAWDDTYEFSCSYDEDGSYITSCWERKVERDPSEWVMFALRDEIGRARKLFPGNQKLLAALMEEVGELAQALLERKTNREIQTEALQVACVAIRLFEEGDADFEGWSK